MDHFEDHEIARVYHLRKLIIAQLQAMYSVVDYSNQGFRQTTYDVIHTTVGNVFVAQAIMYATNFTNKNKMPDRWSMVATGRSKQGVMAATEDLWRVLQNAMPDNMRGG